MKNLFLLLAATVFSFAAFAAKTYNIDNVRGRAAETDRNNLSDPYGIGKMPLNESGEVVFSKVIQAEGKDKAQLYSAARLLITDMFKSAKDVIQLDDKDGGIIVAKGWSEIADDCQVWYTLRIQCRDNRYKVEIYQIVGKKDGGYISGIRFPEFSIAAERLSDEESFKPDGSITTRGKGGLLRRGVIFWRKSIIDVAHGLINTIESGMLHSNTLPDAMDEW